MTDQPQDPGAFVPREFTAFMRDLDHPPPVSWLVAPYRVRHEVQYRSADYAAAGSRATPYLYRVRVERDYQARRLCCDKVFTPLEFESLASSDPWDRAFDKAKVEIEEHIDVLRRADHGPLP